MKIDKAKDLLGCCGIYCGLCPKYQSKAKSRCIGCRLGPQHDWCSIWNCCVKKHRFETCAECREYPCERYKRRLAKYPEDWKTAQENLDKIKRSKRGWLKEQKERQALVEELLENYNEGRSMSFYCKACVKMSTNLINKAIKVAKKRIVSEKIDKSDIKSKAKIVKDTMKKLSSELNVEID
jgi:Zn-dependent M32 family carboxypeptidase